MRFWLLYFFFTANSLFAQLDDIDPRKNLRIPISVQEIILGSDTQDFRGYFRDTSSIFSIKFDAIKQYHDSSGIHITKGTGRYWYNDKIVHFHYQLYPLAYLDTSGSSVYRDVHCHFLIKIIEDSSFGIMFCKGYVSGWLKNNQLLDPWPWIRDYRVNGYRTSYSPHFFPQKHRIYWSYWTWYSTHVHTGNGELALIDLNSQKRDDRPGIKGSWGVSNTFHWPKSTKIPVKNWHQTE